MENEKLSTDEIIHEYKDDVHRLLKYIPWLQSKVGQNVADAYQGDNLTERSITFPVYDSTLLSFVKEVKKTKLIDRNYVYAYSRYRMRNSQDELKYIEKAKITEMNLLKGILSKYILKGTTKATVWTEGVENSVFLEVLMKLRELIEFYDGPLN